MLYDSNFIMHICNMLTCINNILKALKIQCYKASGMFSENL